MPPQKGAGLNVKYAIWFIPPTIWEKYEKSKKRAKYDFGSDMSLTTQYVAPQMLNLSRKCQSMKYP